MMLLVEYIQQNATHVHSRYNSSDKDLTWLQYWPKAFNCTLCTQLIQQKVEKCILTVWSQDRCGQQPLVSEQTVHSLLMFMTRPLGVFVGDN